MEKNTSIEEILKYCDIADLHQFIIGYVAKSPEFEKAFLARFNPRQGSLADKKDYTIDIEHAFKNNRMKGNSRYDRWDDFSFDAQDVAEDLQPLLEKADYYLQHKNVAEAILICEALIETIPDEWESDVDYDGDVQVIYDGARSEERR